MEKKALIATCLALVVLSFLAQPAYASSNSQDPIAFIIELIVGIIQAIIRFLVWLIELFLAFLAQLFGV